MMKITSQGPSHLQPAEQRYWVAPCHILCRSALSTWDAATSGLLGTADKVRLSQQRLCQVIHAKGSQTSQENWRGDIDFCGWTSSPQKLFGKSDRPQTKPCGRPDDSLGNWFGDRRSEGTNQIKRPPNCARRRTTWKGTWEGRRSK